MASIGDTVTIRNSLVYLKYHGKSGIIIGIDKTGDIVAYDLGSELCDPIHGQFYCDFEINIK